MVSGEAAEEGDCIGCDPVRIALWFGVGLLAAQANAQPRAPVFAVGSIRLSAPGTPGMLYQLPGDRFRVQGLTLENLISYAWDTHRPRSPGCDPSANIGHRTPACFVGRPG